LPRPSPRAYLLITLFALAMVLLPFLFWYSTWFGRRLSDTQLDEYFADAAHPRHVQHALVQVGERIVRGQSVTRWYPRVIAQVVSPSFEVRQTAAWLMGQDRAYPPFHDALARLLSDPEPMVRRNAALSLAGFGDARARPELLAMLKGFTVMAPATGVVRWRVKPGDTVNPGTLVAHVGGREVRVPVPGAVRALDVAEGAAAGQGSALLEVSADPDHVWEALRALYIVGRSADLNDVRRFTQPLPGMPDRVARQAALTARAIVARGGARGEARRE
jgi:biotin carboxyl carrier protein